jgi:hypothetical protein
MASVAQGGTGGAAVAKTADQPQQAFSESLSAASKVSSETDKANDGSTKVTGRKKSDSEDNESTSAVDQGASTKSSVVTLLAVQPEQVVPVRQAQASTSDYVPFQLSLGNAVAPADVTTAMAAQPENALPSAAFSGKNSSLTAEDASAGVASASAANNASANQMIPLQTASDQTVALADASAFTNVANQPASVKKAGDGLAGTSFAGVSNFSLGSKAEQSADGIRVPDVVENGGTDTVQNVRSNELANAGAEISGDVGSDAATSAGVNEVASNSTQDAVLNAASAASRGADAAPVLKTALSASVKAALASAASNASANQVTTPAISTDQKVVSANASASANAANQLASVKRASDGLAGTSHAGVSNFSMVSTAEQSAMTAANGKTGSKDTAKDSTSDAAGTKKHADITADQSESQVGVQWTTLSTNQNQSDASSQGQNAVPMQMNYASHSAVAVSQNMVSATLTPGDSQHTGNTSTVAMSPLTSASVPDILPQTSPVINTAKLINSMGQSEMRVGMRSDEFGNISISTTASKGAITAQISLDHGELAKIISAQLPEMQTRLGSGQTVNVHIDMNSTGTGQGAGQGAGQGSGQGSGTSGNTANSSYDQSRGGGQQASYAASSYESGNIAESQLSPVIATAITGYASGKSRLDIRV